MTEEQLVVEFCSPSFEANVQGRDYRFSFVHVSEHPHFWGSGTTCAHCERLSDGAKIYALAYCSDSEPGFNPDRGCKEALKKLMAMLPWEKVDRQKVWTQYKYAKIRRNLRGLYDIVKGSTELMTILKR